MVASPVATEQGVSALLLWRLRGIGPWGRGIGGQMTGMSARVHVKCSGEAIYTSLCDWLNPVDSCCSSRGFTTDRLGRLRVVR